MSLVKCYHVTIVEKTPPHLFMNICDIVAKLIFAVYNDLLFDGNQVTLFKDFEY